MVLPPEPCLEALLVVTTRASSGWKPVMLLNTPQLTGRPTTELSSLADVSPAPVLPALLAAGEMPGDPTWP